MCFHTSDVTRQRISNHMEAPHCRWLQ